MLQRRVLCFAVASLPLALARRGQAQTGPVRAAASLGKPAGPPILTVSGHIGVTNDGDTAVFDRAMLEGMGLTAFRTSTPWYKDVATFEGVPMATLMDSVRAKGETLTVTALNDYTSDVPIADFARYHPILALKRDGHYMEVRDKGPLFVVYPYDSAPELQSQRFYSRSPWQVARMDVR